MRAIDHLARDGTADGEVPGGFHGEAGVDRDEPVSADGVGQVASRITDLQNATAGRTEVLDQQALDVGKGKGILRVGSDKLLKSMLTGDPDVTLPTMEKVLSAVAGADVVVPFAKFTWAIG